MTSGQDSRCETRDSASCFRVVFGPMILLALCPLAVNLFSATMVHAEANGSLLRMLSLIAQSEDSLSILFPRPTIRATTCLALFVFMQLILLCTVPGKVFAGPRAPSGHVPTYRENGLLCFFCTLVAVAMVVAAGWCPATLIYDELQPLMTLLSTTALAASFCLYIKGLKCPSTADSGSSGNIFIDLYWGTELYPRVCGVDLKQFVICRLGMVLWCLFAVSFAAKTIELAPDGRLSNSQLVSASLMCVYIAKFFYWERWYLHAADIQVDRFGFMLCWGTLCFMPLVHTLQNLFLVRHRGLDLSATQAVVWLAVGNLMTWINYDSDTQRHRVRSSRGKCLVWGRPARVIPAKYRTADGREHTALLSVCGYNGLARHFHYLPDIVNLALYCAPAGFSHVLPHTYFLYLTPLLLDRTGRIDRRCRDKYGETWTRYCAMVPHKLVPGVW